MCWSAIARPSSSSPSTRTTWGGSSDEAGAPPRRCAPCSTPQRAGKASGRCSTSWIEVVRIGKVVRAIGLKGHLGIAGSDDALGKLERVVLRRGEEGGGRAILEARRQGKLWA